MSIYYQNVRGLRTKLSNLHTNFVLSTHDVYILTETWLSKEISDAELGLDGYVTFRCDRNINTSSSLRGGGTFISVHAKIRPTLVSSPVLNVEQVFVRISLPGVASALLAGIYLPPCSDVSRYENHSDAMDHVWESYQFDFGIVCGDFNLPILDGLLGTLALNMMVLLTDKVRQIGDQYGALHFEQKNNVPNISNSFLDLVFTNNKFVKVEESSEPLLPCDMYHPALTISCTCPLDIPVLNNSHSFHDFKHG